MFDKTTLKSSLNDVSVFEQYLACFPINTKTYLLMKKSCDSNFWRTVRMKPRFFYGRWNIGKCSLHS